MSALMTWNRGLASYAKAASTLLGQIDALIAMGNAATAEAGCRWTMCSSNNASNPYYVCFKRKNGAPGRIIFVSPTVSITHNKTHLTGRPSIVGDRITGFYFPNATTDVPSGFTGGGNVFDDDTGVNAVIDGQGAYNQAGSFRMWDCEDGIFIASTYNTNLGGGGAVHSFACGLLLEDEAGKEWPAYIQHNFGANFVFNGTASTLVSSKVSGTPFYGTWAFKYSSLGYLNDLTNSQTFFLPIVICSPQFPYGNWNAFKLRQMAYSRGNAGAGEVINTVGPVPVAYHPSLQTGQTIPWLLNFII